MSLEMSWEMGNGKPGKGEGLGWVGFSVEMISMFVVWMLRAWARCCSSCISQHRSFTLANAEYC